MTATALVPARRRLEGISPRTWEHPADRAALSTLRAIPGFDEALKKVVCLEGERGIRLAFQADAVRVTPRQFPTFIATGNGYTTRWTRASSMSCTWRSRRW